MGGNQEYSREKVVYELEPLTKREITRAVGIAEIVQVTEPIIAEESKRVWGGRPVREWDYVGRAKLLMEAYEKGNEWIADNEFDEMIELLWEEKIRQDKNLNVSSSLLRSVVPTDEYEAITLQLGSPFLSEDEKQKLRILRDQMFPSSQEAKYREMDKLVRTLENNVAIRRSIVPWMFR